MPAEALTSLSESRVNGSALWSINTSHTGVHFTLFWPTQISPEEKAEISQLSGEEKKLITQSPALLSFILKRKRLVDSVKSENCCEAESNQEVESNQEDQSDHECCSHTAPANQICVGSKRSRPPTPIDSSDSIKIPKLETSASDSGLSSPNEVKKSEKLKEEPSELASTASAEWIKNEDAKSEPGRPFPKSKFG